MTDSLRDQLLQLGFKPTPKARDPRPRRDGRHDGAGAQRKGKGQGGERGEPGATRGRHGSDGKRQQKDAGAGKRAAGGAEMDLGKAYALRQQAEKSERQRAEQARQEEARRRREEKQKLTRLLDGKALNQPEAESARHFEFGGKIRRVYVTDVQFKAINAGELGVVQHNGRYLLVDAAVAREAAAITPGSLALLVDPTAPDATDDYADPRYQVPDDLVW